MDIKDYLKERFFVAYAVDEKGEWAPIQVPKCLETKFREEESRWKMVNQMGMPLLRYAEFLGEALENL